jgi:peptide/nickel transport system permease protein
MTLTQSIAVRRSMRARSFFSKPLLTAAIVVIVVVTIAVYAAPWIAPYPPLQQDLNLIFAPPSSAHWLGTDGLGRDIYSRLLYGGQPALSGVAAALLVFVIVGVLLGVLAGFLRGWVDRVIVGILDIMLSVPAIIIILAVLAIFDQNVFAAMAVLGLFASAGLARVVRSSSIALREELFVDAARVSGLSALQTMVSHILPSLVGLMLIQMALFAGIALAVQTGLGFLGLATPAPAPSWGGMVGEAAQVIQQYPWFLYITGGVIAVMSIAFGLVGDGLRDASAARRGRSGKRPVARADADLTPVDASQALLRVRDYSIAFGTPDGVSTVVEGVDFEVREGEIFGLVGESGSGKTVTALSLLGLLPDNGAVTSGYAELAGERISPASDAVRHRIRGREIGLVSQEPMVALDPHYTIGSQLSEVIRAIGDVGRDRKAVKARAVQLLTDVRLPNPEQVLRQYPFELSGGMIQRVVIAIALAGSPRLLLADEPTTALDVTVQAGILDLLRSLRDERGMAVILVTHDLGVVADVCDRAIVMQKGRVVEEGPIDDIFYSPQHPYTVSLLESTPNIVSVRNV